MQVQKIQCARVYHINVVLRIRTSVQDTNKDKAYKEKSLQIQRCHAHSLCPPTCVCPAALDSPSPLPQSVVSCHTGNDPIGTAASHVKHRMC